MYLSRRDRNRADRVPVARRRIYRHFDPSIKCDELVDVETIGTASWNPESERARYSLDHLLFEYLVCSAFFIVVIQFFSDCDAILPIPPTRWLASFI